MCPLVEILHSKGYDISGSDNNESDTLNRVRSLGIPVVLEQRAENIEGAEMIVYTAAILPDNPELCAAKASGIPTFERKDLLGAVTRMFDNCICVCGTHGKTTVTSMLTQIFIQSGADPTAVIGGRLPLTGTNGVAGKSNTPCLYLPKCLLIASRDSSLMPCSILQASCAATSPLTPSDTSRSVRIVCRS